MIIRCPNCEYSRTLSISGIPASAELATCPKCRHRFRFRTLSSALEDAPEKSDVPRRETPPRPETAPQFTGNTPSGSQGLDIWDAMDALNQRWEKQMDQNVTEVVTPRPADAAPEKADPDIPPAPENTAPDDVTQPSAASLDAVDTDRSEENPEENTDDAAPTEIPYAPLTGTPEERAEEGLRLLHAQVHRPLRDLGRIDDYTDSLEKSTGVAVASAGDIPWENPQTHGWIRAFVNTVHEVMFNAPAFFSRLQPYGSLVSGYLFFLLLGYIAILGSVLWTQTALYLLPSLRDQAQSSADIPLLLLLAPLALGCMQVFVTGSIRIMQRLFSSGQAEFVLVFKVVSYAVAPFVLSVVPFVGPVVGAIWFLLSLFIGCRHGLGLSWRLAVAVPLLPALVFIYGVAWYFL